MTSETTTITLPISTDAPLVGGLAMLIFLASTVVLFALPRVALPREKTPDRREGFLARWFRTMQLKPVEDAVIRLVFAAFIALFFMAIAGAFVMVVGVLREALTPPADASPAASLGLGALLVALLGAPFLIWRTLVAQHTLDTTRDGLVTDRINAAVASLGAVKEVNRIGRSIRYRASDIWHTEFEWQDTRFAYPEDAIFRKDDPPAEWQNIAVTLPNMEVRVGAIHALGRIARENLNFHVQIMEILCAYVRENAPASGAVLYEPPKFLVNDIEEDLTPEAIKIYLEELRSGLHPFLESLPKPRTDIQTALEVLGRRTPSQKRREGGWPDPEQDASCIFDQPFPSPPPYPNRGSVEDLKGWSKKLADFRKAAGEWSEQIRTARTYRHDLRNTNLQGHDLSHLDLRGVDLGWAQVQGANLGKAQLQGANLGKAQLQGARLSSAQLQGANLNGAQMQGANLGGAQMRGADLSGVQLQGAYLGRALLSEGTNLTALALQGAAVTYVATTNITRLLPHWGDIICFFETLPDGAPAHSVETGKEIDKDIFRAQWRAWAGSLDPPVTIALDYRPY